MKSTLITSSCTIRDANLRHYNLDAGGVLSTDQRTDRCAYGHSGQTKYRFAWQGWRKHEMSLHLGRGLSCGMGR